MTLMKAVRLITSGEKPILQLGDEPVPTPGPNEVLIRVHAASLNFRDNAVLSIPYGAKAKKDTVPLSDGAGEVTSIGEDVTRVKVGDRVTAHCFVHWIGGQFLPEYQSNSIGFTVDGMLAEYAVLHENAIVPIPSYMSYQEAASIPCAAGAAWSSLNVATPLQPGQTVLIQGTGGVSLFALQFARMFGARVLAITSTDEKAAKLKELGAEAVVNYNTFPDWEQEILALTDGLGVDKVVEVAGAKTIAKSAASTRIRGEVALVGSSSGYDGSLSPIDLLYRSLILSTGTIGPRTNLEAMLKAMAVTQVHPVIDKVYPFAEYREAYRRVESGKQIGKVIIDLTK